MNKVTEKQKNTILSRMKPLVKQLRNKDFRDSYLESHVKMFLAVQIRNLRGERSQGEFAKILGTTQSVVSRYENPEYGQVTLQTLLDIASKLDIALVVRFASFPDFLKATSDFSVRAQLPESYNQKKLDDLLMSYEVPETSLADAGSLSYYGRESNDSLMKREQSLAHGQPAPDGILCVLVKNNNGSQPGLRGV